MRTSFRSVCLRTRHSTRVMIRVQRSPQRKSRVITRLRVCAGLPAMARLVYSPRLVMDDYAGEDLLRRQAVVSVDVDGRVADAESFAEVVIFVRDALRELYDVCVVGHWDIDAILGAAYEEVILHCQSPDRGRVWFCGVYSQNQESRADYPQAHPGGVHSDEKQLRRRNDGDESTAFLRLGSGACPEIPHSVSRRYAPKRHTTRSRACEPGFVFVAASFL